jgi:putative spermidine/putrescine transport system permease protein
VRRLLVRRRAGLLVLLTPPVGWMVAVYIVALAALLVTAFFSTDPFTGDVVRTWGLGNLKRLVTAGLYRAVTARTVLIALAVTVIDLLIALPVGFYMSKIASPKAERRLLIAFMAPLWASYLVKVYAWRSVLSQGGIAGWVLSQFGAAPSYGTVAVVITLAYLWLPYVVLPIHAGFERVPDNLLEAAEDLGASPTRTVTKVVLPLVGPAIVAGSIFAFCLTLGDYITVNIVGGKTQMLGSLIYTDVGTANNMPLAAAVALIPLAIMALYLALVAKTGALDNL